MKFTEIPNGWPPFIVHEDLTDFLRPHLAELRALDQTLRPVADGMWELVWFAHSKEEDELTKQIRALDLVRGGNIQANLSRHFELTCISK